MILPTGIDRDPGSVQMHRGRHGTLSRITWTAGPNIWLARAYGQA
jgi:hypothetical protein